VPSAGELAVFCRPVVTAPAVVRRDGTVLADAWLPDLVRLGELERHLGDGAVEAAVDAAVAEGRLKPRQRRRIMSYPLVIRLMLATGLMPDASYCEALARLTGLLADIPLAREWHVPTQKVITDWRLPVPPDILESLFWQAAGPLTTGDEPSAVTLAGMPVAAADGMPVNLADTPANRAFFGSTGTADGSGPFPQLRLVAVTARAGRARLGAILGQAGAGEQTLLKRLVKRRPSLFAGLVVCFDRNFPGHELILAILAARGHVVARVKEGIPLPSGDGPGRGWLPDGSRMTWLNAPSGKKKTGSRFAPPSTTSSCPPATANKSRRRPARSSPPCWTTRKPPLTRSATPTSPGGAPPRPRSARTGPRSSAPGAAPVARSCGPAPRGWSSPKPGPG
jgi:hypothetical protein